jgi:hypothetical protein
MNLIKKLLLLLSIFFLNGCIEATALMGPAITVGTSGNIYQAGLSYGTNQVVQRTTGKSPIQHIAEFLDPDNQHEGNMSSLTRQKINDAKLKIKNHQGDFVKNMNENFEETKTLIKNYIINSKN